VRGICVVGGINMDLVVQVPHIPRPGETVHGGAVSRFPGGKGANQAVAASRLGASVGLVGQVGMDAFGAELLGTLAAAGVETSAVRRVSGTATGVALISVASDGQNAIVVAPGANMAWEDSAVAGIEWAVAECRLLVLNLEVPPAVIAAVIRAAKRGGAWVILNPAPYRSGDEACFGEVDVLVPNQVEAASYAGMDPDAVTDWGAVGQELRQLGPRAVIITLGGAGSAIINSTETTHVPGFAVPVVDTTAAGDAFVGGLAAALMRELPLHDAVRFANACGAMAVTRAGAQPSLPRRDEVEHLMVGGR
jgi:ribokinase